MILLYALQNYRRILWRLGLGLALLGCLSLFACDHNEDDLIGAGGYAQRSDDFFKNINLEKLG